ncbi:hypothetical protein [Dactylosporangium sp. NPDC048998]|uniref:hypothetical protein n=1 Tax=Dactylosporangium sp. NPDC048998 TaxID=3363976 RepID=UPI00372212BA
MLHRAITFAYAVLMVVSAAMAFIVMRYFDDMTVTGPAFVIGFDRSDNGAPGPQVAAMVEQFARDRRVNIGRISSDPRDAGSRYLCLAVGDPGAESARWLEHGYPYFSRDAKIEMRPYAEVANAHPDGLYFVYGPEPAATALLEQFKLLGYPGQIQRSFTPVELVGQYGNGLLLRTAFVVGFAIILLVAAAVTLNAKSYGIQRLHGRSFTSVLSRDLRQLARFAAGAAAVVCALTVAALYLYNGMHRIDSFASVALLFAGAYLAVALMTHVVTLALIHRDEILNAVIGEVTADWAVVGSYVLRVAAVALTFSVGTATIVSGAALSEERRHAVAWEPLSGLYFMRISSATLDERNGAAISGRLGQWVRAADARNEVTLAWRQHSGNLMTRTAGQDVLVVNEKYIADHAVYDTAGAPVRPSAGDAIRVLLPQRYAAQSAGIDVEVTEWVKFMASRSASRSAAPIIRLETVRGGQALPSFTQSADEGAFTVTDLIVVVVPAASGVIPDDEYTAAASRGEVLVEDPDGAMASLAQAGLGAYVLGMSPFAQEAADRYRDAKLEFGLQVFNLVVTVGLLLITAVALAIVYCRRNAQALFAKYVSGWSFVRAHRWPLLIESGLGLALMVWSWHSTSSAIDRYQQPGSPPPPVGLLPLHGWEPLLAGGVAAACVAVFTVVLLRTHAAFVRTHSAGLA